jgi:DNA-binding CsgD family transcriptional regulator
LTARTDLVGIIEASYRLDLPDEEWLTVLVQAAGPHFDHGKGVYGFCFDASKAGQFKLWGTVVPDGALVIPELIEKWHAALEPEQIWRMYRGPLQFASISQRLGGAELEQDQEAMQRFCRRIGIVDQLTLRGVDPTYKGVAVCTPLGDVAAPTARDTGLWTRIAAHISSGFRLRSYLAAMRVASSPALADGQVSGRRPSAGLPDSQVSGRRPSAGLPDRADAVCEADGRIAHANGEATGEQARASLQDAVVAIDRARSKLRREDPQEAVDIWRGLVSGTWTLVEHFESDGRRYLLALKNTPETQNPKALTERERQAVHYATLGHSTKETAYALGISNETVAVHLWSAMKKLGVDSRVELLKLMSSVGL